MSAKGVLISFFSGAAVGAAVALLYAPQKGKFLRAEIVKRADEVNEYLQDAAAKTSDAVRGMMKKTTAAA